MGIMARMHADIETLRETLDAVGGAGHDEDAEMASYHSALRALAGDRRHLENVAIECAETMRADGLHVTWGDLVTRLVCRLDDVAREAERCAPVHVDALLRQLIEAAAKQVAPRYAGHAAAVPAVVRRLAAAMARGGECGYDRPRAGAPIAAREVA